MTTLSAPEVLVIGAGPYGLSWTEQMPVGMVLKSEGFASSLSDPEGRSSLPEYAKQHGAPYRDTGLPIPLETFSDYGLWFQRERVPIVEDTEVVTLARNGDGFTAQFATWHWLA